MKRQSLILKGRQALGDMVMLTAAVRDLHRSYPGRFVTDVRSAFPDLWDHNPHLTPLAEEDPAVRAVDCHYPLVKYANFWPYHFLHGFLHFLNRELRLAIRPWEFRGDIHLSADERNAPSWTERLCGRHIPYWIVNAGGKLDFTTKWWDPERYQQVVDAFHGRILFLQVGHAADRHCALRNVVDLRGQTTLRELIGLVHRAQGALCPITGLMHLSAAVPPPGDQPASRPCVVVAGGLEPPHWETYPHHQFIHTVGMLPCCSLGGCWRPRVTPVGDGDPRDLPENLCLNVVDGKLPRCMDMITSAEVVRRIEGYFAGGVCTYLTQGDQRRLTFAGIWKRGDCLPIKNIKRRGLPASNARQKKQF
jgi:hypothetical protein